MSQNPNASISDALRHAINTSEMSLNEISNRTGVQRASMSRFLGGQTIQLKTADAIAEALGMELVRTKKRAAKPRGRKQTE